jgi:hypothetical protein
MEKHQLKLLVTELVEIDYKIKTNRYYVEGVMHPSGHKLPGHWEQKRPIEEMTLIWNRKSAIIQALEKEGCISDEEYKKFIMSEKAEFTPIIVIPE